MINHEFTITGSSTAFFRLAMHLRAQGHEIQQLPINPPVRCRLAFAHLGRPLSYLTHSTHRLSMPRSGV